MRAVDPALGMVGARMVLSRRVIRVHVDIGRQLVLQVGLSSVRASAVVLFVYLRVSVKV
jgi:hypothetical protein